MRTLIRPNYKQALSVDAKKELDLRIGVAFSRFQTLYFRVCAALFFFFDFLKTNLTNVLAKSRKCCCPLLFLEFLHRLDLARMFSSAFLRLTGGFTITDCFRF